VYRSAATILVESSKPKIVSIGEVYSSLGGAQREFYQTQFEILKSRVLGGSGSSLIGLSQLVAGEAPLERCVYPVAQGSNLSVLPSGRIPPNPLELLASHGFATMLEKLAQTFGMIVIDSPPVQLVNDALVLSNLASEVIYVVKADDTPYPLARLGICRLRRVNAPILGVVLDQLDPVKADRYYGEYSGYGKRYYNKKYSYGYTPKKD
jgi:capsular exopolysaccharide synthesis family protein